MKKSLAKNSIFNTIYTVLNILFPLITSVYVARVILADGVGKVAYAQSIVSYFVLLAFLGIPNYGLREIAKLKDDKEKKSKLFSELISINFLSTSLSLVAYIITISIVPSFRSQLPLFFACGSLIVLNYFNVDWFYQGEEEYVYIVCRSIFIKIISTICLFLFVKEKEDYVLYAWILTCATGGNYILNAINIRKYVRFSFRNLNLKQHMRSILIFAGGIILSNIYSNIDTTMLGILASNHSIGIYNYAHKIVQLSITVCISITAVFLPRLSYYYTSDKAMFMELVNKGIRLLTFTTIPMTVGIFTIAPDIIHLLYGQAFMTSAVTVRVLCILIIVKGFGDLLCFQLISCTGNEAHRIPAVFIANIANIILNALLIPLFVENGAAIASVISEVIVNWYQLRIVRKTVSLRLDTNTLWHAICGSGVMLVYCLLIKSTNLPMIINLSALIGGGIIIYFAVNCLFKDKIAVLLFQQVKKFIVRK